jgi:hypothetical protein
VEEAAGWADGGEALDSYSKWLHGDFYLSRTNSSMEALQSCKHFIVQQVFATPLRVHVKALEKPSGKTNAKGQLQLHLNPPTRTVTNQLMKQLSSF